MFRGWYQPMTGQKVPFVETLNALAGLLSRTARRRFARISLVLGLLSPARRIVAHACARARKSSTNSTTSSSPTTSSDGDGFAWGPGEPTSIRPPLYPAWSPPSGRSPARATCRPSGSCRSGLAWLTTALVFALGRRLFTTPGGPLRRRRLLAVSVVHLLQLHDPDRNAVHAAARRVRAADGDARRRRRGRGSRCVRPDARPRRARRAACSGRCR